MGRAREKWEELMRWAELREVCRAILSRNVYTLISVVYR